MNAANLAVANKARQDSVKNVAAQKLVAAKAARDSVRAALANASKARHNSLKKATDSRLAAAKTAKDSARILLNAATVARRDSLKNAAAVKLAAIKAAKDYVSDALIARNKLRSDSIADAQLAKLSASQKRRQDSAATKQPPNPVDGFTVNVADLQTVMILLNKVDPVYLSECLNAFNRYHQRIGGQLTTQKVKLNNDYSIVLVSSPAFVNADAAMAYVNKVRPKAATEIVPWLEANKFSFYLISAANLETLKQNQKVADYLKALHFAMPAAF